MESEGSKKLEVDINRILNEKKKEFLPLWRNNWIAAVRRPEKLLKNF